MQEEAAASVLVHAASNCRQIVSGHKFTLERHFEGDGPWVVYEVGHTASEAADLRSGGGDFSYQNHFSCFPVALPFRPPRVTPIPTVRGTQTAVVVGPAGRGDLHGQVRAHQGAVPLGPGGQERTPTAPAGSGSRRRGPAQRWGAIHIPRIGQEVVVDFLEGDPDQPIVIGSVYNAECMPPYDLPANKTQSGIKSRSSLGGGPANFNEIRFEDKKGHEELHRPRREEPGHRRSRPTRRHSVGHDRSKTIDHDDTLTITKGFQKTTVKKGPSQLYVDDNNREVIVAKQYYLLAKSIYEEAGEESVQVKGTTFIDLRVGNNYIGINNAGDIGISSESRFGALVGSNHVLIDKSGKIEIKADSEVVVTVGASSIKVNSGGVEVSGPQIKLNC